MSCESQPHKGYITSKLNSMTVPVLTSLDLYLIFSFHILISPVHPTRFFSCFFPGFLTIYILFSFFISPPYSGSEV